MLQFIFGRPASGKTYTVIKKIGQAVSAGRQAVLLVPEQFSFESERLVLHSLGDSAAMNVSVVSFSRLFDEVRRVAGGMAGTPLSEADKVILMKKALSAVSHELKLWGRYCRSISFAQTMLDTIGEFKTSAIPPEALFSAAESMDETPLKSKLLNTALIYRTYDALTGERFIDPSDKLTLLYRALERCRFFEGKTVFIDSFKGFTGQQYKIIDRIIAQAEDCFVSLTNDPENPREYDVFTNIRTVVQRLERSARAHSIKIAEPLILGESRYFTTGLSNLERLMAGVALPEGTPGDGITLCHAETAADEAQFAARTIRRLVREKGYRYLDFVIIARDTARYEESVLRACRENDLSCFMDRVLPLSSFPAAVAVNSAIQAIQRLSTEHILRFHKTGLTSLEYEEISALENYTYLWNIDGAAWLAEWTMDTRGMVVDEEDIRADDKELERLNLLREKAIEPLLKFKNNFSGNAAQLAGAIVRLLEDCAAGEKLAEICAGLRGADEFITPDALRQSYDLYMKLLDSLVRCFGKERIDSEEFAELLQLAVSISSVGVIPQMLDQVTFGAADRIRPSRPKVAFILGANQGVFPKYQSSNGVFSLNERQRLIKLGIEINDDTVTQAMEENFLVYSSLCCPSERLYISCYTHDAAGEQVEPSAFFTIIKEKLAVNEVFEPSQRLDRYSLPQTAAAALQEFCRRFSSDRAEAETIRLAVVGRPEHKKMENIENFLSGAPKTIDPENAKRLFGETIYMSASKLDTFHHCHFSYFCRYGLGVEKLRPAVFDALQRGTMMHYVLEKLITVHKKGISDLSGDELGAQVEKYANEYLDSIKGYRKVETARSRFLVSKIVRALKEVAQQIAADFAQSRFEPAYCEFKIGYPGGTEAVNIPFESGNIVIKGKIDRVDTFGEYLRIVDYKNRQPYL